MLWIIKQQQIWKRLVADCVFVQVWNGRKIWWHYLKSYIWFVTQSEQAQSWMSCLKQTLATLGIYSDTHPPLIRVLWFSRQNHVSEVILTHTQTYYCWWHKDWNINSRDVMLFSHLRKNWSLVPHNRDQPVNLLQLVSIPPETQFLINCGLWWYHSYQTFLWYQ